ncbi:MAG: hypothetical protein UV65_C0013G0012, partial [Parcubacteria group bacterium GW2011_GWF2_43_11]
MNYRNYYYSIIQLLYCQYANIQKLPDVFRKTSDISYLIFGIIISCFLC